VQRSCVLLAFFGIFSVAHAGLCPAKFANLTTCKIMNGWPALGNSSQIAYLGALGLRTLDAQMNTSVAFGLSMTKDTPACKATMTDYSCISATFGSTQVVNANTVPTYATTCNDADGTPMKPCRGWCIEIFKTCGISPFDTDIMIAALCQGDTTATTKCYGNDGVNGMWPGSATGSAAIPRPYPPSVVLPLAVAVVGLGTVLSGNAPA
jgi:hypothetical protein